MKVALIQSAIVWENPEANRAYFSRKIDSIAEEIDLVVLPEMFTTGFSMNPQAVAESMQDATVLWLQSLAKARQLAITGSVIIEEGGQFYNRLLFVFPSGEVQFYDKRHLFTLAGEDKTYSAGKDRLIVEYKGFRICPLVCYDLRFPVFSRNTEDYDLLIYVASWPKPRINAWDILLRARAVENICYTIGVNRIGQDNNKHEYIGHSQVADFLGNYIIKPNESEDIFIATLDKDAMLETRSRLAFLNDRDNFTIID